MTKLSDLIEAGSKKYGLLRNGFIKINLNGSICACPMAMAALAQGCPVDAIENTEDSLVNIERYLEEYDVVTTRKVERPTNRGHMDNIDDIVISLVDIHGWDADGVVAWLRSIGE